MLELLILNFRLGVLGFGGPFAVIALMESEYVQRRRWFTAAEFNQSFSIIKVLPGTTATQMAIYLAQRRAGRLAGFLCGIVFVLPSVLSVLLLSIFYAQAQAVSQLSTLFQGMQLGALLVIAESVFRMALPYARSPRAAFIAAASCALIYLRPGLEPLVIVGFGAVGVAGLARRFTGLWSVAFPAFLKVAGPSSAAGQLALICFKASFLVFGTGLAVIPVLEADVVTKYHWLTHAQFLDGLAIGQITPGPVVTTATFIGYKVAGLYGALLATLAIFSSAFINPLILLPIVEGRMRGSPRLKDFTDWAFPAVIGGIVATSLRLAQSTVTSWYLAVSGGVLAFALFRLRPPTWAFIPLSGLLIFAFARFF